MKNLLLIITILLFSCNREPEEYCGKLLDFRGEPNDQVRVIYKITYKKNPKTIDIIIPRSEFKILDTNNTICLYLTKEQLKD